MPTKTYSITPTTDYQSLVNRPVIVRRLVRGTPWSLEGHFARLRWMGDMAGGEFVENTGRHYYLALMDGDRITVCD
jgi:hypothetical protein